MSPQLSEVTEWTPHSKVSSPSNFEPWLRLPLTYLLLQDHWNEGAQPAPGAPLYLVASPDTTTAAASIPGSEEPYMVQLPEVESQLVPSQALHSTTAQRRPTPCTQYHPDPQTNLKNSVLKHHQDLLSLCRLHLYLLHFPKHFLFLEELAASLPEVSDSS